MSPASPSSPWSYHARQWSQVGSPLRPCAEDRVLYADAMPLELAEAQQVLVLGATPELVNLPWRDDARVLCVDRSLPMLQAMRGEWRRPAATVAALAGDWRALPLPAATVDVLVADGSFCVLPDAIALDACMVSAHEVLRPGGVMVSRLFCLPDVPEPVHQVIDAARHGRGGGFHAWKWRLVMALHASAADWTLDDVWRCVAGAFTDRDGLARANGWKRAALDTIDAYCGSAARYHFMTLEGYANRLASRFAVTSVATAGYPLAERCPLVRWVRVGAAAD